MELEIQRITEISRLHHELTTQKIINKDLNTELENIYTVLINLICRIEKERK